MFIIDFLWSVIPFLVLLTVIIFIHEYGHFIVARWCGVKVTTFSIGFGKELFGFNDSKGTRWKVCIVPLGGYVMFYGDADEASSAADQDQIDSMDESQRSESFHHKPLWQRSLIVAGGPFANFLSAVVMFAAIALYSGSTTYETKIIEALEDSPAQSADIRADDILVAFNGTDLPDVREVPTLIRSFRGQQIEVSLRREGRLITTSVIPNPDTGLIGVRLGAGEIKSVEPISIVDSVDLGVTSVVAIIRRTLSVVGDMFAGSEDPAQLGGIIQIGVEASNAAKGGVDQFVQLVAFISVSIGLLNLFPIPPLDGGRLVFYAYEAVARRPAGEMTSQVITLIGLAAVVALMVFALFNDIVRLIS